MSLSSKKTTFKKPYLRNGIDYLYDRERVYLTISGKEKISLLSLSGSKIHHFFTEDTSFKTWMKLFSLDEWKGGNQWDTTDQEEYSEVEQKIRDYLKKELGLDFLGYGFWERNFFNDSLKRHLDTQKWDTEIINSTLGGVPDGVVWASKENPSIEAILEIKTINLHNKDWEEKNWIKYLMQTLLYMYLAKTDTGYICVIEIDSDENGRVESANITLTSPLKWYNTKHEKEFKESCVALQNENFSFNYTLQRATNEGKTDTKLYLFKIQLNLQQIKPMIHKMSKWWREHSHVSPKMNQEELLIISQKW